MKVLVTKKRFEDYPFEVGDYLEVCDLITDNPINEGNIFGPFYHLVIDGEKTSWIISIDDIHTLPPIKPHKRLKRHII